MEKTLGLLTLLVVVTLATPIHKQRGGDEEEGRVASKRTFCNAFTGCGRKRSEGPPPPRDYGDYGGEGAAGVGGEGPEDGAMEEVARDILAEARLWEALQARNSLRPPQQWRKEGGRRRGGDEQGN